MTMSAESPSLTVGHGEAHSAEPAEKPARPSLYPSPGLGAWLRAMQGSLCFTTYQSARLFLLHADANNQVSVLERIVGNAMGLAVDQQGFWLANKRQLWRFVNIGPKSAGETDFDAAYMPRKAYFVGPCDVHDILSNVSYRGVHYELLFVNSQYSCIAAVDDFHRFRAIWQPDFISTIAAGDRCHLNGMCARDGELAYATLCARSDTPGGWRAEKNGGGSVVDLASGATVCSGLSMPHSPRWHEGRLWLLNSGAGEFGYVELVTRTFVPIARCPGFARGLAFVGGYALIGLSKLRESVWSSGLPLPADLKERHIREMCGVVVIDLSNGQTVHWLKIEGEVNELYDVAFLNGVMHPFTPGFVEPEQMFGEGGVGVDEFSVAPVG